jgi:hypothetical protein
MTEPSKKTHGADALDSMLPTELLTIAGWLEARVKEMRPDRSSIQEEYGCDLVMLLDNLAKSILLDRAEKKAKSR